MRGNGKTMSGADDGLAVPEYKSQVQESHAFCTPGNSLSTDIYLTDARNGGHSNTECWKLAGVREHP